MALDWRAHAMQQPREQQSFGGLLRWYRTNAGLTQEQLAKRAGLSRRGIADLERGARRAPYAHTVRQLATALGLPCAESASLLEAARHQAARPVLRVIVATGKDASAATQPRHNLRAQLTSFVGRQTDRAQVASLLQSSSLVTLVGSGGVGKTRLALEVAADQVE